MRRRIQKPWGDGHAIGSQNLYWERFTQCGMEVIGHGSNQAELVPWEVMTPLGPPGEDGLNRIEAVPNDPIYLPHSRAGEGVHKMICDGACHNESPLKDSGLSNTPDCRARRLLFPRNGGK